MCMEDVCLGRKSKTQTSQVTVTTGSARVIQRNENRTHLLVGTDATNNVFLYPEGAALGNNGIPLVTAYPILDLDIQSHGNLVQEAFWAVAVTASVVITVCETILNEPCK